MLKTNLIHLSTEIKILEVKRLGIGIASLIHHVAIQRTEQNIANDSLFIPSNGPIKNKKK